MSSKSVKALILFLGSISFLQTSFLSATDDNIHINRFKKFLDNFHVVQPGFLYRSAQLKPSRLKRYIKKYGIKSVINLRGVNKNMAWWKAEKAALKELNVNYYNIPFSAKVISSKKNIQRLLNLYKYVPKPILIHCRNGSDRSGEAAALWILEQQKKQKKDALKHLSMKYGYIKFMRPKKHFLISIWQGKEWFIKKYNPENYTSQIKNS